MIDAHSRIPRALLLITCTLLFVSQPLVAENSQTPSSIPSSTPSPTWNIEMGIELPIEKTQHSVGLG